MEVFAAASRSQLWLDEGWECADLRLSTVPELLIRRLSLRYCRSIKKATSSRPAFESRPQFGLKSHSIKLPPNAKCRPSGDALSADIH